MPIHLRLLLLEDNPPDAESIVEELTRAGFEPDWKRVETEGDFLAALGPSIDLVLAEHALPRYGALDALRAVRERGLDLPLIIVSGAGGEEEAVAAIKEGAADVLAKDRLSRLGLAVAQALAQRDLRRKAEAAEAALRESERRLSESQRLAGIGSWTIELPGWQVTWSDETYRVYGVSPDAFIPSMDSLIGLLHPDDRAAMEEWTRACLDGEKPGDLEFRSISPDGSLRIINGRGELVLDEANRPLRMIGTAQDITGRRQVEGALRDSEERFRRLAENAPDLVYRYEFSPRRGFSYVSPAAMAITGYTPEEHYADPDLGLKLVHPDDLHLLEAVSAGELPPGTPISLRWVRKDGEVVWTEQRNTPIFDAAGNMVAVEGIARDITERRRVQDALTESEERYRLLVDQSPYAIGVYQDGELVFVNPAALALLGARSADELIGRPISALLRPDRWQVAQERIGRLLQGETGLYPVEEFVVRLDGSEVPVESTAALFTFRGRPAVQVITLDVTERRLAQDRLRESEERYRLLVDESPYAIAIHQEGSVVFVNRAAVLMMGAESPDELLGRPISALVHPDRWEAAQERIGRMLRGETGLYPVDDCYVRLDGSEVQVEVTAAPFTFRGRPAVQVIALDITERALAQERLRESEERFRATFEQAAVGIAHVAPDGRWLRVNQKLCDIVGYSRDELLQKSFRDITYPGEVESGVEAQRRLLAGEISVFSEEKRYLRKDGSPVWVALTVSLVRTASSEPDYFISVTEDISARKQAEATLELESAALGAAADAIVITDTAGTIEWVNPSFSAVTGYGAEEAIGKNPRDLLKSGAHDQAFYKDLWDTILGGGVWQGEITNRRKDGSRYFAEESITPVRVAGGEISHFIAVARDVTERKRLEAQFLQSQKMEGVGQLAGGIAHDFNNLINVITGTASLASHQLKADDPLQEDLREITRAADRAAAMTRQLLAFSRKQIMEPKVLDLGRLVLDLAGMLRRLIGEDVELTVAPAKGSCSVRADPGQIEQVVMNLAINARDAMPMGGALKIETEAVEAGGHPDAAYPFLAPGAYVQLTISDSGVGMDEATRTRIFEPFFTTKDVGKGTGLGLSTVYGIVQQSGGTIRVESEIGHGTSFRIWFPRVQEGAPRDEPAPAVAPERGAETILVVEDYDGLRQLARRMLERAGYSVLVASDGAEALQTLERHDRPVHLLLTDVVMPGMNGRELAARMMAAHPDLKVIYTSGQTDDALSLRGIEADAAHFLRKPYTHEDLLRAVRRALDAV